MEQTPALARLPGHNCSRSRAGNGSSPCRRIEVRAGSSAFRGPIAALALVIAGLASSPAFAQADAIRGKKSYETTCTICHSLSANGIGPSHKGVYGRKAGSMAGYNYSPGFGKANLVWDEKTLDAWIAFPENLVPGQKMGFYVMEAEVRADIIAYLKSLAAPTK